MENDITQNLVSGGKITRAQGTMPLDEMNSL